VSPDEEAVDLLTRLVSIRSHSGEEAQASGFLAEWMERRGFRARVDEAGNAVGEIGEGPSEVLLLGHIDTVPGDIPVRREGNVLHGRGTVDAKGPLCALACAAARARPPKGWRVVVAGAVEEEAASSKGARHLLAVREAPDFCVIGEPSRWSRITLGYKGRVTLAAEIRAPFVHSAGRGRLPAEWGVELWRSLESLAADQDGSESKRGEFDRLSASLHEMTTREEGGFGRVEMRASFRLPPALSPKGVREMVFRRLEADLGRSGELTAAATPGADGACFRFRLRPNEGPDSDVELTVCFSQGEPAFRASRSNALVRSFLSAIRERGGEPSFVLKTGTSDMNVVGPHWTDTAIVAYGPGDSALDHTPAERIDLDEYHRAISVLTDVLQQLRSDPARARAAAGAIERGEDRNG
jgi:LysW-gamma-L-lysine carboxypeptidase